MWKYNYTHELYHKGTKGMKWGYTDGSKNGKRTAKEVANDVIEGKYGNGSDRIKALKKEGYDAKEIQNIVNNKINGKKKSSSNKKSKIDTKTSKIVDSVINGKFGNGKKRVSELKKAGYDYAKIQHLVNVKLLGSKAANKIIKSRDLSDNNKKKINYKAVK